MQSFSPEKLKLKDFEQYLLPHDDREYSGDKSEMVIKVLLETSFQENIFNLYDFVIGKQYPDIFFFTSQIKDTAGIPEEVVLTIVDLEVLWRNLIETWDVVIIELCRNIKMQENLFALLSIWQLRFDEFKKCEEFQRVTLILFQRYLFV